MTLIGALADAGLTVAVAESLTGGAVCVELSREPGSSQVFRAGVVAYSVAAKERILGVDAELLATGGPVDPRVAIAMAEGVARLATADVGVGTTGVAGPAPHGGHQPGEAYVGWTLHGRSGCLRVRAPGDREAVVSRVTGVTVTLLRQLAEHGSPGAVGPGVVIVS